MAKKKKIFKWPVLFLAGIFVIFYTIAIFDSLKGSEIPGVVTNSERQIGYRKWDTSIVADDGKMFETFSTIPTQTGDTVTVTKNGESYRFGSKIFIILKSILWIVFTVLVLIFIKKDYKNKMIRIEKISKDNIPGMLLTVMFLLLIFIIGF